MKTQKIVRAIAEEPPAPTRPPRAPALLDLRGDDATDALAQLRADLCLPHPAIAPKYFYDPLGATLFEAITRLPEYYLTRTEAALLAEHGSAIAGHILDSTTTRAGEATLIDLGAGNGDKAEDWIVAVQPRRYIAVDIALAGLPAALERLQQRHPAVEMMGVGCDFSRHLRLPPHEGTPIFLYPGSSIGNFSPEAAGAFLRQVHAASAGGGLLIGVDLVKPRALLEAAYDDALGVTAAFNRNVLLHVNRLIGADFAPADWSHVAFFDAVHSRMEMHLEARRAVAVSWPGGGRTFEKGLRIHTENSYKWRVDDFAALLQQSGFRDQRHWTDARGHFAVFWAVC
jgi:dimethylhistidine N-methyltransferase